MNIHPARYTRSLSIVKIYLGHHTRVEGIADERARPHGPRPGKGGDRGRPRERHWRRARSSVVGCHSHKPRVAPGGAGLDRCARRSANGRPGATIIASRRSRGRPRPSGDGRRPARPASRQVRLIDTALERLGHQESRRCHECDGFIGLARPRALPFAPRCRPWEDRRERRESRETARRPEWAWERPADLRPS